MSETGKPERRFQFSLRRLLLWTTVVALVLSFLATQSSSARGGWLFVAGWVSLLLVLRWGFGRKVAATVSVVAGMLVALFLYLVWASSRTDLDLGVVYGGILVACLFGGIFGLLPVMVTEMICRAIDWIDRIGQTDG